MMHIKQHTSANISRCCILSGLLVFLLLFVFSGPAYAETLTVSGTGAALPTMERIAKSFKSANPDIKLKIITPPMGSSGSVRGLSGGFLDIALSARSLTGEEKKSGLVMQPYAKTAMVFAVGAKQAFVNVSTQELIAIYSGDKKEWSAGERLRLIMRPANDSDITLLKTLSSALAQTVDETLARNHLTYAITDYDSAECIEKIPGAFGTSTLAMILATQSSMKALHLDGIAPTLNNVENGSYPLTKTFHVVTRQNPTATVQRFINFIYSKTGSKILADSGNLALYR